MKKMGMEVENRSPQKGGKQGLPPRLSLSPRNGDREGEEAIASSSLQVGMRLRFGLGREG